MRIFGYMAGLVLGVLLMAGCSNTDDVAGIEIGNPGLANRNPASDSVQSLAFKAGFTIDYSDVLPAKEENASILTRSTSVAKSASKNEPLVIDSMYLTLTEVRSYCSFYVGVSIVQSMGLVVWPYENSPYDVLPVSFVDDELIDETFSSIDLQSEGRLKEVGVSFEISRRTHPSVQGRVMIGDVYVPFVYELSRFQQFSLRYHFSQIKVEDWIANLSVAFHVRHFTDGVDLSSLEVGRDGVVRIDSTNNTAVWEKFNERFVPSFGALRYEYLDEKGHTFDDYVNDILLEVVGDVGENVVTDGSLGSYSPDWIFLTQLRGEADSAYVNVKEKTRAIEIDVTSAGQYSYSVQLMHENIPMLAGHKYKCSFLIRASEEGLITARIGSYLTYETVGFEEHVQVTTSEKNFEVEFEPMVNDPFARFEFNIGGAVRKIWVRDLKITRLD
ncbi:MAG: carbohydrate binding domain-containing protein [Fibrobacter sp.]|uniref:carbohydrate binding domain-containing protein n=1 Tax=Fibrobacter sp. TaxID=35828 RepID=UPI001B0B511C|nr:carbohydrate binding domain-containing protein [Fibrobacter sp.]MBO7062510.1 carbohydrate binding domain-containing protein [Fibrobacter sp.]